jgi:hypothetical protein
MENISVVLAIALGAHSGRSPLLGGVGEGAPSHSISQYHFIICVNNSGASINKSVDDNDSGIIKQEAPRTRQYLVTELAERFNVLVAPDLLEVLLQMKGDPIKAVREVIARLPTCPLVLTWDDFKVLL